MLTSLSVVHLRIVERLRLDLGKGMTVFVGDNAQGKTSILEAVCLLLRLSSPRARSLGQCVRHGSEGLAVKGRWAGSEQRVVVRGRERIAERDGQRLARASEYLRGSGLLVWMGSEDLDLVRGGAEGRRRYLDFLGEQLLPGYRAARQGYDVARAQRNRLLRDGRTGTELDAFTAELVRHGEELMSRRADLVEQLRAPAAEALDRLGAGERLELGFSRGAEEDFAAHLVARAEAEIRRGQTLVGPHRDDLRLSIEDRPAADFASEGQQRSIALALKLAQGRLLAARAEQPPIWLIDDVFGELDPGRRHALLTEFAPGSQQLVTTTTLDWLDQALFRPTAVHRVVGGTVAGDRVEGSE